MIADKRGRVRFGYRLPVGASSGGDYTPLRIEVGPNGTVNITTRDRLWGEEGAPSSVYRDLMGNRDFIRRLHKAQAVTAAWTIRNRLLNSVPSYEVAAMS